MDHPVDLAGVLSFCNDVRQQLGRKPVTKLRRGLSGEPQRCPIANTINHGARNRVFIDSATVDFGTEETFIANTAPAAKDFLFAFDGHKLPEFDGTGWAE